ncbi:uncharacterized protein LOC132791962 isoform X1 [Drosophila nasuta]|uniref:uncharacterized protein LOC132791962 isoform X1 n=1 Tax=Drosophila nasuta TaxID=42062 RepID=UPI00295E8BAC|nr:uncharacterized protein LOC132791962 isoform X1 [Drosophila nasuta]XP_060657103.1 uncharacterized protein LOC132791962 isoform X1 [Drosophila nasuta]
MMNNTRNTCINVDENVAHAVAASAGGATAAATAAATTMTTTAATPTTATAMPEFVQLNETRRYIYRVIAAIHDESFNKLMNRLLRQFECAIREGFESAQNSPLLCRKLARSIIALTDQIHTLHTRHGSDNSCNNAKTYRQRICYIVAIYIACELCAAQDHVEKERCILERIGSMLSLYVEDGDVACGLLKEHTLRTLVAIPKVFGQANIITVLYSRLFPQWSSTSSVFSQTELPDRIYIEYIIIFYCWQRLERDEATRHRIIEFASRFMRPSSTLPCNATYRNYLPDYGASRTATRSILEYLNVQQSCTGLRAASRLDNRTSQSNDVIFDSDEEKATSESGLMLVSAMAAAITLTKTPLPPPAPDPPDFLKTLCENAKRLEPVKRATALYRGIDSTCEVVDLCESDDDVEMFSLDFSVPANVDGNASSSNEASATQLDDYLPVTRIFPSNLRTYQRATSSAANALVNATTGAETTSIATTTTTETYTMPRIVNSYSCRRDSLHLVSTTQTPPHLVDQCVQTAEQEEEQEQQQLENVQNESFGFEDDAISPCMFYSDSRMPLVTHSSSPALICEGSSSNMETASLENNHNHHCHQPSSRNSNSSEASLQKKQVTFSTDLLGASSSSGFGKTHKIIKPTIKRYKQVNYMSRISLTPTSSMDHVETLKWMGHREHLQAGQRMFSKVEAKKHCDKGTGEALSAVNRRRKRQATDKRSCVTVADMATPTIELTPTTSNASSGTPTPQPKRLQSRAPQRSLPTPPASTHSSNGTVRHGQCERSTDIDINQLQAEASSYKFNRHKFADSSLKHVRFYNNLLKLQRMKMQEKRDESDESASVAMSSASLPQKQNAKTKPKQKNQNRNKLKLKRLHALNGKLRQKADELEGNLEIITNYAKEERAKAAALSQIEATPIPIVRLKRIHVKEMIVPHSDIEEDLVEHQEDILIPPVKRAWNRRRRRKGHQWSRIKNVQKKKQQAAVAHTIYDDSSDLQSTQADHSIDNCVTKAAEPSVTASVPLATPAIIIASASSTSPSLDSANVPVHTPSTAAPSVTSRASSSSVSDRCQTEQDLSIAAYVTLAVNGESCDDQDAVMKQISQLPTPSPEIEQSSAMVAHEIEVATSNVPVYLLNGESRDVTTPVSASLTSED